MKQYNRHAGIIAYMHYSQGTYTKGRPDYSVAYTSYIIQSVRDEQTSEEHLRYISQLKQFLQICTQLEHCRNAL